MGFVLNFTNKKGKVLQFIFYISFSFLNLIIKNSNIWEPHYNFTDILHLLKQLKGTYFVSVLAWSLFGVAAIGNQIGHQPSGNSLQHKRHTW
jgi:hypothetical protein